MVPTTRQEFSAYCLRRLGDGVIKVNVSPEQVDDRVDEALAYFWNYHFDGTDKCYYKYEVTPTDITTKYITVPSNIIGVINIFDIGMYLGTSNMFNVTYQFALNDLYMLTSQNLAPYTMARQNMELVEQLLVGKVPLRYNRKNNKLYLDCDWTRFQPGMFIIVEAYSIVDPTEYPSVWSDIWLQRYCTALIKKQWGVNVSKHLGVQMLGGVTFNGDRIATDAAQELKDLEEEIKMNYQMPPYDLIG